MSISCFLIDMRIISEILKIFTGIFIIFRCPPSTCQLSKISKSQKFQIVTFKIPYFQFANFPISNYQSCQVTLMFQIHFILSPFWGSILLLPYFLKTITALHTMSTEQEKPKQVDLWHKLKVVWFDPNSHSRLPIACFRLLASLEFFCGLMYRHLSLRCLFVLLFCFANFNIIIV